MSDPQIEILKAILAPVAKFCLRRGFSVSSVSETLKLVLVEQAAKEISAQEQRVTVSQISVMTGVTRREVQRLHLEKRVGPGSLNIAMRIINRWQNDRGFIDKKGEPRVLTYGTEDSEFNELAYSVSKDINPGTVLRELERLGLVAPERRGLRLIEKIHSVQGQPHQGINLLLRDIDTLTRAAEENIADPKRSVRNAHLRTEFDNVFLDSIPKVRSWLMDEVRKLHKRFRDFLSEHDKDLNPDESRKGGGKVVVGTFSWTDPS